MENQEKPLKHTYGKCKGKGVLKFETLSVEFNEVLGVEMPHIVMECSICGDLYYENMRAMGLLEGDDDDLEEI